jgi:hypothetical protein
MDVLPPSQARLHTAATDNPIYSDNQAAIRLVRNPEFHKRTKHIDLQYHKVCEEASRGAIVLAYIPTMDQPANVLTKALLHDKFERMKQLLNLTATPVEDNTDDIGTPL